MHINKQCNKCTKISHEDSFHLQSRIKHRLQKIQTNKADIKHVALNLQWSFSCSYSKIQNVQTLVPPPLTKSSSTAVDGKRKPMRMKVKKRGGICLSFLSPISVKRLAILFRVNLLFLLCMGKILWLRYLQHVIKITLMTNTTTLTQKHGIEICINPLPCLT